MSYFLISDIYFANANKLRKFIEEIPSAKIPIAKRNQSIYLVNCFFQMLAVIFA